MSRSWTVACLHALRIGTNDLLEAASLIVVCQRTRLDRRAGLSPVLEGDSLPQTPHSYEQGMWGDMAR